MTMVGYGRSSYNQRRQRDMYNIRELAESDLDYRDEIVDSIAEAKSYLMKFGWCDEIREGWLAASFGYILNILYFEIVPDYKSCTDTHVWVVVGDLPPAYIDTISAPSAHDALQVYISIMQEWVDAVMAEKSVEDCFPVNVPPQKHYAEMLNTRLGLLKSDFLPLIPTENAQINIKTGRQ